MDAGSKGTWPEVLNDRKKLKIVMEVWKFCFVKWKSMVMTIMSMR